MVLRIRTKIIISFASLLILFAFFAFISYHIKNILFNSTIALEKEIKEAKAFADLQLAIDMAVMPANDYIITGDIREKDKFEKIAGDVESAFARLEGLGPGTDVLDLIRTTKAKFAMLRHKAREIFDIPDPRRDKRSARLMQEMDAIADDIIVNDIEKQSKIEKDEIAKVMLSTEDVRRKADAIYLAGVIIGTTLTLFLISYLVKSFLTPILKFREGAYIVESGNLDHRIDIRGGLEINLLAEEFNKMTARLKSSYAELEGKVEERTRELNEANKQLTELSIRDGLTGAYNHRYFYQRLTDEINRARRYGRQISLIMADIDHFKNYNDTNGHTEGDKVLAETAACMSGNVRDHDVVARYGGEEFAVILPETDSEGARAVAERLRRIISEKAFLNEESQPGGDLTVSMGVATFPRDGEDLDVIIEKADRALYSVKENGRNRIEVA